MGLERLKSAFSDIIHTSEIEGRHGKSPITNSPFLPTSILDATTYAYNSITDEPITDLEFNSPLLADLYNDTGTSLIDPSSNINFQIGFGSWENPSVKLVMSGDGVQTSLSYIESATGGMVVASGAVTKLGKASSFLNKVGIDTPNLDFGAQLDLIPPDPEPLFLTYPMQVEEMFNPNGGNLTNEFANTGNPDSTRGIAFQVLGDINQSGIGQDFSFQDKVVNTKTITWINPVAGFTPGNIQFKDDYFKDIGQSLGLLGSVDTPDIGLNLTGLDLDLSGDAGLDLKGIKFDTDFFSDMNLNFGGIFEGIGGFGKRLPKPKFPKLDIDFGAVGDFFGGVGSAVGGFAKGVGSAVGGFAKGVGSFAGDVGDTIKEVAGPIGAAIKDVASNLNPLDELKLPQIELQNPRQVSVTDYGGQAIFKKNQPRALQNIIPQTAIPPSENTSPTDKGTKPNVKSTPYAQIGQVRYAGVGTLGKLKAPTSFYPNASMDETAGGDKMTLADIKGPTLSEYDTGGVNEIDSADNGMPFFFKDLRNNTYIIFRGYLEGIGDTVSPSWSDQSYIGRSEKNYIYTGTDRSLSLSFKLAAQTMHELDSIYYKLNKLTSLAYPQYMPDQFLQTGTQLNSTATERIPVFKTRMKPPLARMRVGDLFGNPSGKTRDGVLGFLESLSYEFPDESPWEFRHGQRVPKIINVSIGWQVIHEQVADMDYPEFYGYNPDRTEAREKLANKSNSTAAETAAGLGLGD